ncbi:MAG TPA: beta-ketoacyl-ACP synthase III [Gemmatimonadales bacterium]|nr:beta-ketoacyl-ACP synthase III [Gemmatimonadales bacterium]
MKRPVARFVGTGRYVPGRIVTNHDYAQVLDTTDEWIRERSGIVERHVASDEETIAYMATKAAGIALADAGVDVTEVDAIVTATASPDRLLPSQACDIQAAIGEKTAAAFDVGAACSGFVYATSVAEGLIATGNARTVLVVGAERLTRIMDIQDRSTAILFGDGVGVGVVRPTDDSRGILSAYLKSDGTLGNLLYRPGGGSLNPPSEQMLAERSYFIRMAGREVFKWAVRSMADACDHAMERAGLTGADVDLLIPHQANTRIIEATAKHAGIPMSKVYVNVDRYGNTSAASIPMALDEAVRNGVVQPGMCVLLVAFGGGFTWASMAVRW